VNGEALAIKEKMIMSQHVSKDMTFAQVMRMHPDVVKVFAKYNLGCIGCMGAQAETLEQGCSAHGLDVNDVVNDLNALF
jgi:hybrid cluster-associated redox disulfide protein